MCCRFPARCEVRGAGRVAGGAPGVGVGSAGDANPAVGEGASGGGGGRRPGARRRAAGYGGRREGGGAGRARWQCGQWAGARAQREHLLGESVGSRQSLSRRACLASSHGPFQEAQGGSISVGSARAWPGHRAHPQRGWAAAASTGGRSGSPCPGSGCATTSCCCVSLPVPPSAPSPLRRLTVLCSFPLFSPPPPRRCPPWTPSRPSPAGRCPFSPTPASSPAQLHQSIHLPFPSPASRQPHPSTPISPNLLTTLTTSTSRPVPPPFLFRVLSILPPPPPPWFGPCLCTRLCFQSTTFARVPHPPFPFLSAVCNARPGLIVTTSRLCRGQPLRPHPLVIRSTLHPDSRPRPIAPFAPRS